MSTYLLDDILVTVAKVVGKKYSVFYDEYKYLISGETWNEIYNAINTILEEKGLEIKQIKVSNVNIGCYPLRLPIEILTCTGNKYRDILYFTSNEHINEFIEFIRKEQIFNKYKHILQMAEIA